MSELKTNDANVPSLRPRSSVWQRVRSTLAWALVFLVAVFLTLVASGVVEVRRPAAPRAAAEPAEANPAESAGETEPALPVVERLYEAEKCFEAAGFEAYAFRYSGGLVECWVEADTDCEQEVFAKDNGWRREMASLVKRANEARTFSKRLPGKADQDDDPTEPPLTPEDARGYVIFMKPASPKSAYAGVPEWNLQASASIESRSGGASYGAYTLMRIPSWQFSEDATGTGAGRGVYASGGHLQQDEERLLLKLRATEPLKDGGIRERQVVRLKCRLLDGDDLGQVP